MIPKYLQRSIQSHFIDSDRAKFTEGDVYNCLIMTLKAEKIEMWLLYFENQKSL